MGDLFHNQLGFQLLILKKGGHWLGLHVSITTQKRPVWVLTRVIDSSIVI